ncbi:hypothetical protein CsSME_00048492 [Camellia sinensis var. sinensis]
MKTRKKELQLLLKRWAKCKCANSLRLGFGRTDNNVGARKNKVTAKRQHGRLTVASQVKKLALSLFLISFIIRFSIKPWKSMKYKKSN